MTKLTEMIKKRMGELDEQEIRIQIDQEELDIEYKERRRKVGEVIEKVEVKLTCLDCGHEWYTDGYNELGATFLNNEKDDICSECEGMGEIE